MYTLKSLAKPFHVNFEITSRCDFKCNFCSARLLESQRTDLPTKDVLKIISNLASENIYSIFLTGGEPFLREDLPKIVEHCINCGMNVTLSTNGANVSKKDAELIAKAGLDEIQVSIHGDNKIHDKIVGLDGAFKYSMRGLQNLIDAGITTTVASVATLENHESLPYLARKVAEMGVSYFRVLRLMTHSQNMLNDLVPHNDMITLVKKLMDIEEENRNISISVTTSPGFLELMSDHRQQYKILHPLCHTCTAGKVAMGIFSDGDCTPCVELRDAKFVCGNLLKNSLSEIWNSKPMSLQRLIYPDMYHGKCGDCKWKWSCYSARCVAYNIKGDILDDDVSCYCFLNSESGTGGFR